MLARILQANGRGLTMVFARTKRAVARITDELQDRHFAVGAVHGDLAQGAREQALRAFRNGKVDVLVATDVAARGIDVEGVTHVINYQCPEDEKVYTHRIGRTGRAGRTGISVTLVDWEDMPRWGLINRSGARLWTLAGSPSGALYSTSPISCSRTWTSRRASSRARCRSSDRGARRPRSRGVLEDLGETGRQRGRPAARTKRRQAQDAEAERCGAAARAHPAAAAAHPLGGQCAAGIAANVDEAPTRSRCTPSAESFESLGAAAGRGRARSNLRRPPTLAAGGGCRRRRRRDRVSRPGRPSGPKGAAAGLGSAGAAAEAVEPRIRSRRGVGGVGGDCAGQRRSAAVGGGDRGRRAGRAGAEA